MTRSPYTLGAMLLAVFAAAPPLDAATGFWDAVAAKVAANSATAGPPAEAEFPTGVWKRVAVQPIPIPAGDAQPLVAAVDGDAQLWIACQTECEVWSFDRRGRRGERLKVDTSGKGPIVSIGFSRAGDLMVMQQRMQYTFPLGEVRWFTSRSSTRRAYSMSSRWLVPRSWPGEVLSQMAKLDRGTGVYLAVNCAGCSRKGTTYVAVPRLQLIEKYSQDARLMGAYPLASLQPFNPVWLIVTRTDDVVVGDSAQNRMVLLDQSARIRGQWGNVPAGEWLAAAHPDGGWYTLDCVSLVLRQWDGEGNIVRAGTMPAGAWAAMLAPGSSTLWLFDARTWTWHTYETA
ncbi:hypothetical protein GX586_04050 [bacterium]|nr:hypothetical protein [bacterium]